MSRSTPMSRRLFTLVFTAALLSAASCLTIADPGSGLAVFSIEGGNNQSVVVGTMAPQALRVRTLSQTNEPLGGLGITWSITTGGGALSSTTTVTDQEGYSEINYTASNTTGTVLVSALAEDLRLTFTLETVSSPPA